MRKRSATYTTLHAILRCPTPHCHSLGHTLVRAHALSDCVEQPPECTDSPSRRVGEGSAELSGLLPIRGSIFQALAAHHPHLTPRHCKPSHTFTSSF